MDNLTSRKVPGVAEAIEAAGATLRYLPRYSPDLNPIEMPLSKFKAYLRKLAQRRNLETGAISLAAEGDWTAARFLPTLFPGLRP